MRQSDNRNHSDAVEVYLFCTVHLGATLIHMTYYIIKLACVKKDGC